MRDPYDVLGVSRTASEADIKSAYRKLAKKLHPDRNKTDPKAKERFAEINSAYEIVGDKDKRGPFDRGEIGADGKSKFQGFEGFGQEGDPRPGAGRSRNFRWSSTQGGGQPFEADDIFADIFGNFRGGGPGGPGPGAGARPQPIRGEDIAAVTAVTLEQLVRGEKARVDLPTGRTLDVKIPAGTQSGKVIRLKGQGQPGLLGGPAGDALVTVEFVPHPVFRVDGDMLRRDVNVSLDDAVLGGKVRVPTLDGDVSVNIPANSTGQRALRLKGKGLPKVSGERGDLLVTPRIVLPESKDADLEALMQKWRESGKSATHGSEQEA